VYAKRNRYDVDPNQELVALGAANLAAGVVSGQPVTGGFARTAVNAASGARTPLSSMVSAGLNVVVLLFLTGLFTELPQTVLAAIVIGAVAGLIDLKEIRHIAQVKRSDLVTLLVTLVGTLLLGVELDIAVAVVASLTVVVVRLMNPHSAELGRLPSGDYRNIARFPEAEQIPGVALLRIDVSLNFANVAFLKRRVARLEQDHPEGLHTIVLDGSGINDLDGSAEAALADLIDELTERGIAVHLASMKGPVRDVLQRSGLWDRLGDRIHLSVQDAVNHLQEHQP
jgi:SulP family sulfate permease